MLMCSFPCVSYVLEVPENLLMDQYMTVSLRSQVIFGQMNSVYQFGDRNLPFRIFKKV